MGYINLMIRLLIGQCAQAWNLQSSPPLKSRGVGGNSGLQAKPFYFPKDSNHKRQASSLTGGPGYDRMNLERINYD